MNQTGNQPSRPSPQQGRTRRTFSAALALGLALAATATTPPAAPAKDAGDLPIEARMAGVVSKIPGYVSRWPGPKGNSITIGVLGSHPIASLLGQITRGQSVDGRPLRVTTVRSAAEAAACQVLFVPARSESLWNSIRNAVDTSAVLTIGETAAFAQRLGGLVAFNPKGGSKIQLLYSRSNYEKSRRQGLKISSRLLTTMDRAD